MPLPGSAPRRQKKIGELNELVEIISIEKMHGNPWPVIRVVLPPPCGRVAGSGSCRNQIVIERAHDFNGGITGRIKMKMQKVTGSVFAALALITVELLLSTLPAAATQSLTTYILPQYDSPVTINGCWAGLADTDVGNVDYYQQQSVQFTITGSRTAIAVRFMFELDSAFNEKLDSIYGTVTGEFSTGVLIDRAHSPIGIVVPMWSTINIWPATAEVLCAVDTVRFTDGTIWNANYPAEIKAAKTGVTPAPATSP